MTASGTRRARLAEVVGVIGRATDVGLGLPIEHAIRTCLLCVEVGRRIGLDDADLADLYYLALLRMLGCTAGSAQYADLFGDEVRFARDTAHLDYGDGQVFGAWVMGHFAQDQPPATREAMIDHLFTYTPERRRESLSGHCEVAQLFAAQLGVGPAVIDGLGYVFERYDGMGAPSGVPGPRQPVIVRVLTLCNELEVHHRLGGPLAADTVARERAGGAFDPELVAAFCADRDAILAVADGPALWDDLLATEPGPPRGLNEPELFRAPG